MARLTCFFPILLVAVLLAFSQGASARVYEEKQNKELPETGAPVVTNPHGTTHLVPHPAGGKGEAHGDLINCFTCPLILKFCCGIFCCSEAQYNEYVKLQGLPHN
ncbi:uncharacterized protein LOC116257277 [Nymphaea colorata]|nr:uncharacterized protein LOC116257277 [Nymphaea colorata]